MLAFDPGKLDASAAILRMSATPILPDSARSPWEAAWRRLRRNRLAVAGGIFVLLFALVCTVGPELFALSYSAQGLEVSGVPPGSRVVKIFDESAPGVVEQVTSLASLRATNALPADQLARLEAGDPASEGGKLYRQSFYLFGGDSPLGRDLFARILYGGRISLLVGLVATLVALVIGVTYGAVAGYVGGGVDRVMMRGVDIMFALPFTIFVILLMVFLKEPMQGFDAWLRNFQLAGRHPFADLQGVGKIVLLFAAIGAVEWLTMARIVRGQVLAIKQMEYIAAARTLGVGSGRIIFRHMLPNLLGPVIVYTSLTIPAVMLLESFLSFLGLGVDAPMSSLGTLIKDGAEKMEEYWWLLVFPGGAFSLTLFALNFLGDGLRDALDVRVSKN